MRGIRGCKDMASAGDVPIEQALRGRWELRITGRFEPHGHFLYTSGRLVIIAIHASPYNTVIAWSPDINSPK